MTRTTSVNLGDLATAFDAWCTQRGVSRSFAIRQLVAAIIGNENQASLPLTASGASVANGFDDWRAPVRMVPGLPRSFTLKMTQQQRDHLTSQAATAGMSCQRYVLAAITARDSDSGAIAGKDAVQALNRSNALLAQVMVHGFGRGGMGERVSKNRAGTAIKGGDLGVLLRGHLFRAAKVLADVELTRAGHTLPKRGAGEWARAKPWGPGRGSGTMG